MEQVGASLPRGGAFRAPFFRWEDLPADEAERDRAGEALPGDACDVQVRMISMGEAHVAALQTGAFCAAVAARVPGTVLAERARTVAPGRLLRIGTASGVVPAFAGVVDGPQGRHARSASMMRMARTLMEGTVYAPTHRLEAAE